MRLITVTAATGLGARISTVIGTSVLAKRVGHDGSQNDQPGCFIRRKFCLLSFEFIKLLAHCFPLLPIKQIQDIPREQGPSTMLLQIIIV